MGCDYRAGKNYNPYANQTDEGFDGKDVYSTMDTDTEPAVPAAAGVSLEEKLAALKGLHSRGYVSLQGQSAFLVVSIKLRIHWSGRWTNRE